MLDVNENDEYIFLKIIPLPSQETLKRRELRGIWTIAPRPFQQL